MLLDLASFLYVVIWLESNVGLNAAVLLMAAIALLDAECRTIAQSMDLPTAVLLARTSGGVDTRLLPPPPPLPPLPTASVCIKVRKLLLRIIMCDGFF